MDTIQHKLKLMEHIFNGGQIVYDRESESSTYTALWNESTEEAINFDNLNNCSIYLDDKYKRILELEATITDLSDKLSLALTQKRKVAKNAREQQESIDSNSNQTKSPYRAHLTVAEVREIEQVFKHDFSTKAKVVMSAYGVSAPIASKIKCGHHAKSSDSYAQHLRNIGQWNQL